MGNNNSKQQNKVDDDNNLLQQFYAKDAENDLIKMNNEIHESVNKTYERIQNNIKKICNEKIEIFSDPLRGIALPYITNTNMSESENNYNSISSENPRYIELIICKDNLNSENINEKFAIHNSYPDHECIGNCHCIKEMFEVVNDADQNYKYSSVNQESYGHNSSMLSPTSDNNVNSQMFGPTGYKHVNHEPKIFDLQALGLDISEPSPVNNEQNYKSNYNNNFSPTSCEAYPIGNEQNYKSNHGNNFSPTSCERVNRRSKSIFDPQALGLDISEPSPVNNEQNYKFNHGDNFSPTSRERVNRESKSIFDSQALGLIVGEPPNKFNHGNNFSPTSRERVNRESKSIFDSQALGLIVGEPPNKFNHGNNFSPTSRERVNRESKSIFDPQALGSIVGEPPNKSNYGNNFSPTSCEHVNRESKSIFDPQALGSIVGEPPNKSNYGNNFSPTSCEHVNRESKSIFDPQALGSIVGEPPNKQNYKLGDELSLTSIDTNPQLSVYNYNENYRSALNNNFQPSDIINVEILYNKNYHPKLNSDPENLTNPEPHRPVHKLLRDNNKHYKSAPICKIFMEGGDKKNTKKDNTASPPDELIESGDEISSTFGTTSTSNAFSTTSASDLTKKSKKTNKKIFTTSSDKEEVNDLFDNSVEDEPDDDNDDLDGLDDDEISENGIIINKSSISSSELYKMQSRFFGSETEDMSEDSNLNIKSKTNKKKLSDTQYRLSDSENITDQMREVMNIKNNRMSDSENITDQIRRAANKRNNRKNLFDSEDMNILNMNSSDKYTTKSYKKNTKYYD